MSFSDKVLAYHLAKRPATRPIDYSHASLVELAKSCNAYKSNATLQVPEDDAISFYLLNHGMALVLQTTSKWEPLGTKFHFVDLYYNKVSSMAARMFHYLLLICTRESRHVHDTEAAKKKLQEKYGTEFEMLWTFTKSLSGSSSAVEKFLNHPPKVKVGTYVTWLVDVFYKGSFGGGYGGKAWGGIADVLHAFCTGKYSAELMLDTSYTLCHNNGPIFNKGMLFHNYDSSEIIKILDVQRSGQIPKLVDSMQSPYVKDHHKDWLKFMVECIPQDKHDQLVGHVDWWMVEALGAVKSYPNEKKAQEQTYGKPTGDYVEKAKAFKETKPKKMPSGGGGDSPEYGIPVGDDEYFVMPGVIVKKVQVRIKDNG